MDQTDKAIEAYKEAARINPANSLPWFDLGAIYYNKGDYGNSEKAYLEAIKIDPTSAQAHANLASVYRQKEKFPEANAEYKKARGQLMAQIRQKQQEAYEKFRADIHI